MLQRAVGRLDRGDPAVDDGGDADDAAGVALLAGAAPELIG